MDLKNEKNKKKIMLIVVVLVVLVVVGLAASVILKKPKKEVTVQEDIYKLPDHVMYYVNDNIYDENIDPATINPEIKVDFTEYYIKENAKKNLNIDLQKDIKLLQKNKGYIYGLYNDRVVSVTKSNKMRSVTSEKETILAYKIFEENIIKYYTVKDINGDIEYFLEAQNIYTNATKIIAEDKVKGFDADKDGIYVVYETGKIKNKIVRYVWNEYVPIVIDEEEADVFIKAEDWIYYVNKTQGDRLYRVYKDGTRKNKITEEALKYPKYSKGEVSAENYLHGYLDTLFYIDTADKNKLYKLEVSENKKTLILDKNVEHMKVVDDFIYFTINNEEGLYVMHKDGTYINKILNKKPTEYLIFTSEMPS